MAEGMCNGAYAPVALGCGVLDILSSCVEVFQSGKGYEGNVGSHTFAVRRSVVGVSLWGGRGVA